MDASRSPVPEEEHAHERNDEYRAEDGVGYGSDVGSATGTSKGSVGIRVGPGRGSAAGGRHDPKAARKEAKRQAKMAKQDAKTARRDAKLRARCPSPVRAEAEAAPWARETHRVFVYDREGGHFEEKPGPPPRYY